MESKYYCFYPVVKLNSEIQKLIWGVQLYLTKLRYEASASISFGPRWLATIGIGDSVPE